jgi:ATP-dependent Lon protease
MTDVSNPKQRATPQRTLPPSRVPSGAAPEGFSAEMMRAISPRGPVLPIGGIKEKVLAALRAGLATVMLPDRTQKDLDAIPPAARQQTTFVWRQTVGDAVAAALEPPKGK